MYTVRTTYVRTYRMCVLEYDYVRVLKLYSEILEIVRIKNFICLFAYKH